MIEIILTLLQRQNGKKIQPAFKVCATQIHTAWFLYINIYKITLVPP